MIQFLIKNRIVVSIAFYVIYFFCAIYYFQHATNAESLFWLGLFLLVFFWAVILVDMIQKPILDKTFWILSMFFLIAFAPTVYLFKRMLKPSFSN
ncbi:hypothetical protein GIHI108528_11245 [Gillisia hiemivivida]